MELTELLKLSVEDLAVMVINQCKISASVKDQFSTLYNKHTALQNTFTETYYHIAKGTFGTELKTGTICTKETVKEAVSSAINNDVWMGELFTVKSVILNGLSISIEAEYIDGALAHFNWKLVEVDIFREFKPRSK